MVAVIKVAGQQYKVEKDQTLYVPHLGGNAGDKVELEVLLVDADGKPLDEPFVVVNVR